MKWLLFVSGLSLLVGCQSQSASVLESASAYPTVDYLTVAKQIRYLGGPTIIDLRNLTKQLVFIGTIHTNDTTYKQFDVMETYFRDLKPQIAFNEGGPLPDTLHYPTRNEAIHRNAETGYLKFLCDQQGIRMQNGDFRESEEFPAMLKKYPREELLLYYTMERLVIPFHNGLEQDSTLELTYTHFVNNYLARHHFPLTDAEKTFAYFTKSYQQHMGEPFDVNTFDLDRFNFLADKGKFCAIGRASKMVRDSVLLSKIDRALDQYDRVFVTFGGAHALAIEPALKKLIEKPRQKL